MVAPTALLTAADLDRLPDDGLQYELVRGVLQSRPPGKRRHGKLANRIGARLTAHVEAHDLGEVYAAETGFLVERNPDTVRAPDVAFVRTERLSELGDDDEYVEGAPDLAVEVISSWDRRSTVAAKAQQWIDYGARLVLVVDPRRATVDVYTPSSPPRTLRPGDVIDGGDVVPGWLLPVASLF